MDRILGLRREMIRLSRIASRESFSGSWFTWQYEIIKFANTVIDAAQKEAVSWNSEEETAMREKHRESESPLKG